MIERILKWLVVAIAASVVLIGMAYAEGCTKAKVEKQEDSIGWNPATMRCQHFDGTKFRGEFLPDTDCADQAMPKALP